MKKNHLPTFLFLTSNLVFKFIIYKVYFKLYRNKQNKNIVKLKDFLSHNMILINNGTVVIS